MPIRLTFFLLLFVFSGSMYSQEICDNALDDDQDGWIDLNDPDCDCRPALPPSPIPNPSFEEQTCCPQTPSRMQCLVGWTQPSEATTDYSHGCDWEEWEQFPIPRPIPDGQGCIGFRDGHFELGDVNPEWKEYVASCLEFPLEQGVSYTFEFSVGFTDIGRSPPIRLAMFGVENCSDVEFGKDDIHFGCPENDPDWAYLGSVEINGINEWRRYQLIIQPQKEIQAIAIGPDCKATERTIDTFYFLDDIVLVEQSDFDPGIQLTAQICEPNSTLSVQARQGYTYQWYKEGFALVGETGPTVPNIYGDGEYRVRLERPDGVCELTEAFLLEKPESFQEVESVICEGETYILGDQELMEEGVYLDTLTTQEGCDSVIILDLQVKSDLGDSIHRKIFPSESYQVGEMQFQTPGVYSVPLQSANGCDSTIVLHLSYYEIFAPTAFSPNGDGVNEHFSLLGGQDVVSISRLAIFNRWGKMVHNQQGLSPGDLSAGWNGNSRGTPAPEGIYLFVAEILFDDGIERTTSGSFTLVR